MKFNILSTILHTWMLCDSIIETHANHKVNCCYEDYFSCKCICNKQKCIKKMNECENDKWSMVEKTICLKEYNSTKSSSRSSSPTYIVCNNLTRLCWERTGCSGEGSVEVITCKSTSSSEDHSPTHIYDYTDKSIRLSSTRSRGIFQVFCQRRCPKERITVHVHHNDTTSVDNRTSTSMDMDVSTTLNDILRLSNMKDDRSDATHKTAQSQQLPMTQRSHQQNNTGNPRIYSTLSRPQSKENDYMLLRFHVSELENSPSNAEQMTPVANGLFKALSDTQACDHNTEVEDQHYESPDDDPDYSCYFFTTDDQEYPCQSFTIDHKLCHKDPTPVQLNDESFNHEYDNVILGEIVDKRTSSLRTSLASSFVEKQSNSASAKDALDSD